MFKKTLAYATIPKHAYDFQGLETDHCCNQYTDAMRQYLEGMARSVRRPIPGVIVTPPRCDYNLCPFTTRNAETTARGRGRQASCLVHEDARQFLSH